MERRNEEEDLNPRQTSLMTFQGRLLHSVFFRLSLTYASLIPKWLRRILETLLLLKALLALLFLIYIHYTFAKTPVNCLDFIKDSWPKEGILRVEIISHASPNYSLQDSYDKERQFHLRESISAGAGDEFMALFKLLYNPKDSTDKNEVHNNDRVFESNRSKEDLRQDNDKSFSTEFDSEFKIEEFHHDIETLETTGLDGHYIAEYSLEYGYLRLSPSTRQKLNLTVDIIVLDPSKNACFGDIFSQFLLQNFLGYDDILILSIKSLAEHEDNKGYLRNVVTGEHYHFVSRWTSSSSYFAAALVMIAFTVSVSMLLRYSQHQIFVFIVELLQMLELNTTIVFPAVPLLTVILALVGMETIMSEFFEDTTTAFYIIMIVWIADQYDAICCRTTVTKRYWLRFFYLYHFSFYAYHYRFSGQYSGLALITMWLFTQHSMIYFYHHYELPVILQQARIQDLLLTNPEERIGHNNININNNNNNNNNNNILNNGDLRRMRGFNIGGFRFRFGIVIQSHNVQPLNTPPVVSNEEPSNEIRDRVENAVVSDENGMESDVQTVTRENEESLDTNDREANSSEVSHDEVELRRRRHPSSS